MHGVTNLTKHWQVQDDMCNILNTFEVTAVGFSEIAEMPTTLSGRFLLWGCFIIPEPLSLDIVRMHNN